MLGGELGSGQKARSRSWGDPHPLTWAWPTRSPRLGVEPCSRGGQERREGQDEKVERLVRFVGGGVEDEEEEGNPGG